MSKNEAATANAVSVGVDVDVIADIGGIAADKIRETVKILKDRIENDYWGLSQALNRVYDETLYIGFGFETFPDYVEKEVGIGIRKAQYLRGIAEAFGKMNPEIQAWIRGIGWSKAKELIGRVDESNWKEWRDRVAGMSVSQLIEYLKGAKKKKGDGEDTEDETGEKPKKLSFYLFPSQIEVVEQAIENAKASSGTDSPNEALAHVATAYVATGLSDMESEIEMLQKKWGIRLIAFNRENHANADTPIYVEDSLSSLFEDDGEETTDDLDDLEDVDDDGDGSEE